MFSKDRPPGPINFVDSPNTPEKTAPDGADTHSHGHGDSMTNSAQWGRVGEKKDKKVILHVATIDLHLI